MNKFYIVGKWIHQKQKIHTKVHFLYILLRILIILYCICKMYILYSIVKDGDLKKTDAKNALCCKFPAVISCFFTNILFRPGLENLRYIRYTQWNRITTIHMFFFISKFFLQLSGFKVGFKLEFLASYYRIN